MEFIPPFVSRFVRFARWLCWFPISRAGRWLFDRRPSWLGLVRRLWLRRAGTWLVEWLPSWLRFVRRGPSWLRIVCRLWLISRFAHGS